jgi:hypothetical protein
MVFSGSAIRSGADAGSCALSASEGFRNIVWQGIEVRGDADLSCQGSGSTRFRGTPVGNDLGDRLARFGLNRFIHGLDQ